jgi:hypothetical protein
LHVHPHVGHSFWFPLLYGVLKAAKGLEILWKHVL